MEFSAKTYRQNLARNSFLDLPIHGLLEQFERMVYEDVTQSDYGEDASTFNWTIAFANILQLYVENEEILVQEKWDAENSEKPNVNRWIGDTDSMWFFPKYVLLLDKVVQELHATLFPPANRKYGRLSSPSLFLAGAEEEGDPQPRCFSSVDDLTYLFYFPGHDALDSIKFGIWKESVAIMSAMQGALERCSHLPKLLTRPLKEEPVKMTEIQVGRGNLLVMDSRLLNARLDSENPTLCVLWSASTKSKSRNNAPIDLIVELDTNVLVLKKLYRKYFSKGNSNFVCSL